MVVLGVLLVISAVVWIAPFRAYAADLTPGIWLLYATLVVAPVLVAVTLGLVLWRPILPDVQRARVRAMSEGGTSVVDVVQGIRGVGEREVVTAVRRLDLVALTCHAGDVGCGATVTGLPGEHVSCARCNSPWTVPHPAEGVFAVALCTGCRSLTFGPVGQSAPCPQCRSTVILPTTAATESLASQCLACSRPVLGHPGESVECPGCGKEQEMPREAVNA